MLLAYECLRIPDKIDNEYLPMLMKRNVSSETLPLIKSHKPKKSTIQQRVNRKF